jgi:phage terminase large subunit
MRFWSYLEGGGTRAVEIAHRRWGKDEICLHWAAVSAMRKPATYWHMLPEAAQARKAIWEAVNPHTGIRRIDEAFPMSIRANTRENEMLIRFVNGATWQVLGSDNFNSLVGSPPFGVVFSEFALANPAAWAYIRPILLENGGWAAFITTPRGKNHAHKILRTAEGSEEWFGEVSGIEDTNLFTPKQMEEERKEMIELFGEDAGEAFFQQEYHCSFEAAVLGAYYGKELAQARRAGRITVVPYDPAYPVGTAWDIGYSDDTSIWFYQIIAGEIRIIECISTHGQDVPYFVGQMVGRKCEMDIIAGKIKFRFLEDIEGLEHRKQYKYNAIWLPHDGAAKTFAAQGKSVQEQLSIHFGWDIVRIVPSLSLQDGIQATRALLKKAWIDEALCALGISAIDGYRREYDPEKQMFRDIPLHDWTSHLSDALRMLAVAYREPPKPKESEPTRWPQDRTINEIIKRQTRRRKESE